MKCLLFTATFGIWNLCKNNLFSHMLSTFIFCRVPHWILSQKLFQRMQSSKLWRKLPIDMHMSKWRLSLCYWMLAAHGHCSQLSIIKYFCVILYTVILCSNYFFCQQALIRIIVYYNHSIFLDSQNNGIRIMDLKNKTWDFESLSNWVCLIKMAILQKKINNPRRIWINTHTVILFIMFGKKMGVRIVMLRI